MDVPFYFESVSRRDRSFQKNSFTHQNWKASGSLRLILMGFKAPAFAMAAIAYQNDSPDGDISIFQVCGLQFRLTALSAPRYYQLRNVGIWRPALSGAHSRRLYFPCPT
jgi:hypothetical protein